MAIDLVDHVLLMDNKIEYHYWLEMNKCGLYRLSVRGGIVFLESNVSFYVHVTVG